VLGVRSETRRSRSDEIDEIFESRMCNMGRCRSVDHAVKGIDQLVKRYRQWRTWQNNARAKEVSGRGRGGHGQAVGKGTELSIDQPPDSARIGHPLRPEPSSFLLTYLGIVLGQR